MHNHVHYIVDTAKENGWNVSTTICVKIFPIMDTTNKEAQLLLHSLAYYTTSGVPHSTNS
ncbi:hypothetical protein J32TS6_36610 [Virgibacillus pantothenticus]|uniref:Uncharacterized protein n=1 Tax=Virgibacillus pantothenticus TaxID=1473 RepID=A0A0L0QRL3_VIRPA|nr:hypothetical protein AFK71_06045 [Virgibacillus pantothenticus]GIP65106.1 hypothetical protein J32TS6_36610 [Virgibacillus pantothenticus]SIS68623.1 hypothetical protein SAMN05421787_102117 [Virgibacillus pantothenticus]